MITMRKTTSIFLIICSVLFSCTKDFIVSDISKKALEVNSPVDDYKTSSNTITFWWQPLEGADSYNLKVVRPSFASPLEVLLDTTIASSKFILTLEPGSYEWSVKGVNSVYSTSLIPYQLQIDSSADLTGLEVKLLSPSASYTTNSSTIKFKWGSLYSASQYKLLINDGQVIDTTIIENSITLSLPSTSGSNSNFRWAVIAKNTESESKLNSIQHQVVIDLKGPATPILNFPLMSATVSLSSDTLKWKVASDVSYDSLYVSEDSTFSGISPIVFAKPFAKLSDLGLLPNSGSNFYFWKVRSFDAFGNKSSFSIVRKFKLSL